MKRWSFLFVCCALSSAAAQDAAKTTIGIGSVVNRSAFYLTNEDVPIVSISPTDIFIPIRFTSWTLEPELGFASTTTKTDVGASTVERKFSSMRLGVGLLKQLARRDGLEPYVGPRVGIIRTSVTEPTGGGTKITGTSWFLTGAVGGQYFFGAHFSIGAEGQLSFTHAGKPTVTGTAGGPPSSSNSVGTFGLTTVRIYF